MHRRDVVCGGGAAVFSAILATLVGSSKPVKAEHISGSVPELDGVAVRVLVDSYQFAVAPSRKLADVDIQHFGWGLSADTPPGKTLISEFGLSMHAETRRGTETRNILMDFGFTPEALLNNVNLVGIDPAGLDALVLSHGHYDHFGGLTGFLRATNGRLKAKLPIYIGGEEAFCSREWTAPPARGDFGALDRKALEDANLTVTYAEQPVLVADHGFTTGQIMAKEPRPIPAGPRNREGHFRQTAINLAVPGKAFGKDRHLLHAPIPFAAQTGAGADIRDASN
jgi:7,8-dihydropterin-6-yl-methyl-4-(beta-D-ribofuranosyl)aminobenzene 5'-phosphate synthase